MLCNLSHSKCLEELLSHCEDCSRIHPLLLWSVNDLFLTAWICVQVERWSKKPEEKLGWEVGDAWGHRRTGYRRMAQMLGGKYLAAYERTFAREPEHTKHIVRDVTPEVKHQVAPIKA